MLREIHLSADLPPVCRLGLATRGNTHLRPDDVEHAIARGLNYLNWCGHPDGMSRAVAALGGSRDQVVVAAQFQARSAADAAREFASMQDQLRTERIDVVTLYYVESEQEWGEITGPGGAWEYLAEQKCRGRVKLIGLTSHQRRLAAAWAGSGRLDLLMIRYNAAHRGARREVFPTTSARGIPVVAFTGLRWRALLAPTPADPAGFQPPGAADWYRFCLAEPAIAVVLTAPGDRRELEENLALLDDWRPPHADQHEALRLHGDRVRGHAGLFW
jgi:predicted aldo/keto reductase-like oxidoreductase